jgi:multiple sugar transport system substrate-binding protein
VVVAAAATALALATGGCTSEPQPTPSPTPTGWTERGPITLAIGPDPSGVWTHLLTEWNASHTDEQVTLRELPEDATQRHETIAGLARARSGELTVIAIDPTWVPEFAENGWLAELPDRSFPTTGLLASRVSAGTVSGKLYAYPVTADVGVLYYRADLLAASGLTPPSTWAELAAACTKVLTGASGTSCYGAALAQSESLTVNVAEAVASAGGVLVQADGTPDVNSTNARLGVRWLAGGAKDGSIPTEALSWNAEAARQAFADGHLVFLRDWSCAEPALRPTGSWTSTATAAAPKLGVAQLPGRSGTGTPVAGGVGLGMSPWGRNQATAADFIRWVGSDAVQRELLEKGSVAPAREALYDDSELAKRVTSLPVLAAAVRSARPLPVTPKYVEVSAAIQAATHPVLKGSQDADDALEALQTKLTDLLK